MIIVLNSFENESLLEIYTKIFTSEMMCFLECTSKESAVGE